MWRLADPAGACRAEVGTMLEPPMAEVCEKGKAKLIEVAETTIWSYLHKAISSPAEGCNNCGLPE